MTNEQLISFLKDGNREDYQRDNFDSFLKKVGFDYSVPSIHIAGTNGKGSTANYISSIYRKEGYKVGLFTSPYLNDLNEMILINDKPISDDDLIKIFKDNEKLINKYQLSVFEIETFIAYTFFQKNNCDIAVIECGMGGEFDATNIFTPILSIITSVSLEHTNYLGKSICEIAANKAGIIKETVPVLLGNLVEEARNKISEIAIENESKIYSVNEIHGMEFTGDGYRFGYLNIDDLYIPSLAKYSISDAKLAIDAVKILDEQFKVSTDSIREGLKTCKIPLRLEKLCDNPCILVDGGHNPEAIFSLIDSLEAVVEDKKLNVVFCCFKDKNIERMLAGIGSIADSITLTTFDNPRAREEADYFLFLEEYKYEENCVKALTDYVEQEPDTITLVTGSFAFAAYMRKMFNEGKIVYEIPTKTEF